MRLLHAFTEVERHRGQGLTNLAHALRQVLAGELGGAAAGGRPVPHPGLAPEGEQAGASLTAVSAPQPPGVPSGPMQGKAAPGQDGEAVQASGEVEVEVPVGAPDEDHGELPMGSPSAVAKEEPEGRAEETFSDPPQQSPAEETADAAWQRRRAALVADGILLAQGRGVAAAAAPAQQSRGAIPISSEAAAALNRMTEQPGQPNAAPSSSPSGLSHDNCKQQ